MNSACQSWWFFDPTSSRWLMGLGRAGIGSGSVQTSRTTDVSHGRELNCGSQVRSTMPITTTSQLHHAPHVSSSSNEHPVQLWAALGGIQMRLCPYVAVVTQSTPVPHWPWIFVTRQQKFPQRSIQDKRQITCVRACWRVWRSAAGL